SGRADGNQPRGAQRAAEQGARHDQPVSPLGNRRRRRWQQTGQQDAGRPARGSIFNSASAGCRCVITIGEAVRMDSLAFPYRRSGVAIILLLCAVTSADAQQLPGVAQPPSPPLLAPPPSASDSDLIAPQLASPLQVPDLSNRENFSAAMQIIVL